MASTPSVYKDEQGVTPLHLACQSRYTDIAKYLITEQHCDPDSCLNDGRTCLHTASASGNLSIIRYLIMKSKCNASSQDYHSHVPSYYALREGYLEAAKYLGCLPNENDKKETLKLSILGGKWDIVKYLFDEGKCTVQDLNSWEKFLFDSKFSHLVIDPEPMQSFSNLFSISGQPKQK